MNKEENINIKLNEIYSELININWKLQKLEDKKQMEDLDFTDEAEIRRQLAKYFGQYLTITFKGSGDQKHI